MARPVIAWVPASAGDRLASCFKGLNADQAWPKLVEGTGVTKGQAQPFGTSFTSLPSLPSVSSHTEPSSLTSTSRIRSEEHTSELQSLMRISYAVFCLKKKTQINDKIPQD